MNTIRMSSLAGPLAAATVLIAGVGCAWAALPEKTPSTTPLATRTASPAVSQTVPSDAPGPTTAASTPTATPAALDPVGPWLLGIGGEDQLLVLNPDGTGLANLEHQRLWAPYLLDQWRGIDVSQTGWIAVRTSASQWPDPPTDIALDLYRLPRIQPTRRIPLFSPALAAQMGEVGKHPVPYEAEPVEGPNWRYGMVYLAVLSERNKPRWSPNGHYLAFSAAIDGVSSDLYVYDTEDDQMRRLTDGPDQAAIMGWSPDSRWIIHVEASTYMIADGGTIGGFPADAVWAAAADGSEVKRLYGPAGVDLIVGWVSDTQFVVERWSGYLFGHELRVVDVNTGGQRAIYPGKFYGGSELAPGPQVAVVDAVPDSPSEEEYFGGLHIVTLDGAAPRQLRPGVETFDAAWIEWFPQLDHFLASGYSPATLFTASGEITTTFQDETGFPAVSLDGSWLAFDNERERAGLRLYRPDAQLVREVTQENVYNFVWTPDSSSLYYLVKAGESTRLMLFTVPDGEPVQLHPEPGFSRFVLVEGKSGSQ